MASRISVTSSGLSSISMMMMCISGLFLWIDLAMSFRSVVFPALGGDTIRPLWPLPMGERMSTILIAISRPVLSILSLSFGKTGVISSKL